MRRAVIFAACAAVTAALAVPAQAGSSGSKTQGKSTEYVVLYKDGVSLDKAHAAVKAAGGTIVSENKAVGVATVRSSSTAFAADARRESAVGGVARNRVIAEVPKSQHSVVNQNLAVEKEGHRDGHAASKPSSHKPGAEPLAGLQWDMARIHATVDGSYKKEPGDHRVLVGVIDTGIDGSHPDIAPNFNRALSRNFTTDIPVDADGNEVDGPCEHPSCVDPADEDDGDHGTHVASSIASPLNGLGVAGVAPNVSLVNLRGGQDSGFFFLQPVVDALTYAGDHGIDVVNMSFYIDPWLFNCTDNPADSPENQAEQRTVIQATERALAYAHRHGVTLVSAAGNGATDYTKTIVDDSSPDFPSVPGEAPYERTIPPSCISEPSEGQNVIAVSSIAPSDRKAYYSDFGLGYAVVSAPGGDAYDTADQKADVTKETLSAYPTHLAVERGELNPDGTPNVPFLVRSCKGSTCAYYQWLQGTSMASPRTVGVVALIVSKYGQRDRVHGGLTLSPARAQAILERTAVEHACPSPPTVTYTRHVKQPDGTFKTVVHSNTCEGSKRNNGFYGHGVIDALRAVS